MNLSEVFKAISQDFPSGENQEYEECFVNLEMAAQPSEERQVGDDIIPAEDPDYAKVLELSEVVLKQSHDLRAAIYLGHASLGTGDFENFSLSLLYVKRILEDYWQTCHPQLDAEDDNDPTMRVNALLTLNDPATFLKALREFPITQSKVFGNLNLKQILLATGETQSSEESDLDANSIDAAFKDTEDEFLTKLLESVNDVIANIKGIEAKFDAEIPGQGPQFIEILKVLMQISDKLNGSAPQISSSSDVENNDVKNSGAETGDNNSDVGEDNISSSTSTSAVKISGSISSTKDVEKTIEKIIEYYKKNEPSSPVPVLLRRAKALVGADFMTIIKDMAPNGVENVEVVGGAQAHEDN